MGARGPAPKPTAIRILEGNPGHRPINRSEPRPKPIAPKCPTWLDAIARREWRRVVPVLEQLGLATEVDMAALASYCTLVSTLIQCEKAIQKYGLIMEINEQGYVQQRPEVAIRQRTLLAIKAFCAEFGLTPSARGRMTLPEADDGENDSPFDL